MQIKMKLLTNSALPPRYSKPGDAGADLFADEEFTLFGGQQKLIKTGIALEIPEGYFGLVRPRSGLATKHGIGINTSGVIDSGYRGEISVNLINHSDYMQTFHVGDRIAQIVILPYVSATFSAVSQLSDSERGEGGYGSTGVGVWE
jgi:dUTP pyrophosphatase